MEESNSILDKVIISKQTTEMQGFNPSETISALLKYLTGKEEEVLRRRFGLDGKSKDTLEAIGKAYHVTRERIRQIENTAIKKIRELNEFKKVFVQLEYTISGVLKKNGGIMEEESLITELLRFSSDNQINRNCIIFILEELLISKIIKISADKNLRKSWSIPSVSLDLINEVSERLIDLVKEFSKPVEVKNLLEKFYQTPYYKEHNDRLPDEAVISYLNLIKRIDRNPFDEYGLTEWGSINPRRMRDKIYLILKKEEKPLHFNKITELINKIKFDNRKAYAPTVHNELILNNDFVLVGRGIYALREWGYKPGVVADVLVDILKKEANLLSREELVKKVLEQRVVRKNTIHLALTDKSKFKKSDDKRYTLLVEDSTPKEK